MFHEDDEAFKIWQNLTGFSEDKIIKIKTNDNFWSMGPTGPCGPCSEIFYDYGNAVKGGLPGTAEQDGARYTEIWNLVFMQYNQVDEKTRIPLEKKGIDTGMGLERLISVLENKIDNYKTSFFEELIHDSKEIIGKNSEGDIAYRILSDHARSTAFLIADGVLPSNEGRGYVLRRIIRRALRHLYMEGYKGGDFHKITGKVIDLMGEDYPELEDARNLILSYSKDEEEKFMSTLPNGMRFLQNEIKNMKEGSSFEVKKAFMLYDTFGFPLDITNDILLSNKMTSVSETDFEKEMEVQRERSKKSWKGSGDAALKADLIQFASGFKPTVFEGYQNLKGKSKILGVFEDFTVLEKTCFYPEGGGQIGDVGFIFDIPVIDTIKVKDVILHKMASVSGLKEGMEVDFEVSEIERRKAQNAHSATHLLHHFLRKKFGETVVQKGSLVERNRLRFDFSLNRPLTLKEIHEIEVLINAEIAKKIEVNEKQTSIDEAKKEGAIAFFGEKYGNEVRVLKIGNSVELCGGTHVSTTSQICAFKIISESAVASGVRRIEALTGEEALNYMLYSSNNFENLRSKFKLSKFSENYKKEKFTQDESFLEIAKLEEKLLSKEKEVMELNLKLALSVEGLLHQNYYIKNVKGLNADLCKQLISNLKSKAKVVILFSELEKSSTLYVFSTDSVSFNALEIGKKLAEKMQGKGGGSAEFANFGGILKKFTESEIASYL